MLSELLIGSSHVWHYTERKVTKRSSTNACILHGFHVELPLCAPVCMAIDKFCQRWPSRRFWQVNLWIKAGTGLAVLMVTVFFPLLPVFCTQSWATSACNLLLFTAVCCVILSDFYTYIVARCCNAHSVIALNGLSLAFALCSVLSAQFLCSQNCYTSGLVMDLAVTSSISSQPTVYNLLSASACE